MKFWNKDIEGIYKYISTERKGEVIGDGDDLELWLFLEDFKETDGEINFWSVS